MLKIAIDVMCKNKRMKLREDEEKKSKVQMWIGKNERMVRVWIEPKKWKNNSLYQSLTVNWMDSNEISACMIQHICEIWMFIE